MSTRVRSFLFLSGLFIFFAWGFRLYILSVRWETDPSRFSALFLGLIAVGVGLFLVRVGLLGNRAGPRHYRGLTAVSLLIITFWGYRLARLVLYPTIDPNPRAHLHLSVTFLVVGCMLLAVGIKGRRVGEADPKP